ncbi:MAG: calcium/sodium antiporter [Planctomycetota bacterium]
MVLRSYLSRIVIADIVSENVYKAMPNWLLWVFVVVALRFLAFGADRVVRGAVRLAGVLGISTVIIGATVVSIGTTTPEAFVSVAAAFRGKPGLALGNGVGSIICDTALIFGLCLCLVRLPHDRFLLHRQGVLYLVFLGMLAVVVYTLAAVNRGFEGAMIPRWVGRAFLVLLVAYMLLSVRWSRRRLNTIPAEAHVEAPREHRVGGAFVDLLMLVEGLAIVYVTSDLLIGSVSKLCLEYGVPADVLAVTVVAFGTSLPELVTAIASIVRGHPGLLVGNVIGADILNVLFVIGASATARPLAVPETFYYLHIPVMLLAGGLMAAYIFGNRGTFKRWQGLPMLAVFVGYYVTMFVLVSKGVIRLDQ